MNDNKLFEKINLYFDGELEKGEEVNLFSLLVNDQGGRDYFKQMSMMRNAVENSVEDFPPELEERILRSIDSKTSRRSGFFSNIRIFSAITYAAAIILFFLSGYLFFKVSNYQERVDNLSQQMMIQSRTIQMFYNSLPAVEIRATFDNEIVVKPNI